MLIYSSTKLINEETLFISLETFHYFISIGISIEVTSNIMTIKVISLEIIWWWEFTTFIELISTKDLLSLFFLDDITSLRINKVTLLIYTITSLINKVSSTLIL